MSCVLDSGIMPVRRPHRLWNFDKPYRWNGVSGGAGVGYNLPASLGGEHEVAVAPERHCQPPMLFVGECCVNISPSAMSYGRQF
jgi:acetolactate synthase-1/2/3 large subunit